MEGEKRSPMSRSAAYLGQLQKVRAALKDLKLAVSVDERDEEQLERTGLAGDGGIGFTEVQVA